MIRNQKPEVIQATKLLQLATKTDLNECLHKYLLSIPTGCCWVTFVYTTCVAMSVLK